MNVRRLLAPTAGLFRDVSIGRLTVPPYLYYCVGDLACASVPGIGHARAGAYGFTRDETLLRGVGEGCERFALAAAGCEPSYDASGAAGSAVSGFVGLPTPAAVADTLPASAHPFGEEVRVATSWVHYPTRGIDAMTWEGSPSGAAAHTNPEAALTNALLELVERDGVMRAWHAPLSAGVVRLKMVPSMDLPAACPEGQHLVGLLDAATFHESHVHVFRTPSAIPGLYAYLSWVVDGGSAAAGATVAGCDVCGCVQSLREAWQVYISMKNLGPRERLAEIVVSRSDERVLHWASELGVACFQEWAGFIDSFAICTVCEHAPTSPGFLISVLQKFGPIVSVDLTSRLPEAVRRSGFTSCKAFVRGLQPLVVDEASPWNSVQPDPAGPAPHWARFQPLL